MMGGTEALNLTIEEREAKSFFHSLGTWTDHNGKSWEVLAGLTREESEWLLNYDRAFPYPDPNDRHSPQHRQRRKALRERHELARLQNIGRSSR